MDDANKEASGNTAAGSSTNTADPVLSVAANGAGDKTANSGDASKAPQEEVRIIEETIIAPAPSGPPKPAEKVPEKVAESAPPLPRDILPTAPSIPSTPAPSTPVPQIQKTFPVIPPIPPVSAVPPIVVPPTVVATQKNTPFALGVPVSPPVTPAPLRDQQPLTITPALPSREPTPPVASAPRPPQEFSKEQEAITKILKEAKLPEQRLAPAQKAPATFDTSLTAALSEPKESSPEKITNAIPIPADKQEVTATAPKSPESKRTVTPLHTLKDDLQSVVRLKKMSLVRAVALEEEKRHHGSGEKEEEVRDEVSARKRQRTSSILITAVVLSLLGVAAFFGVFLVMQDRGGGKLSIPQSEILFAESGVPFPLDGNALELKRLLANARLSENGTLGSITRIIPTIAETSEDGAPLERPATLQEFLRALGTRVPDELTRALSQNFFFGIHTVDENAPLFVVPVISYERAFAGMLAWEGTVSADLSPVFTPVPDQAIGGSGLPEKRRFDDVVMRNYDVRVLKDDSGTIQIYYSFPTRALLVIAESPYSFTEILSRLRAERKL